MNELAFNFYPYIMVHIEFAHFTVPQVVIRVALRRTEWLIPDCLFVSNFVYIGMTLTAAHGLSCNVGFDLVDGELALCVPRGVNNGY